MCNVYAKKNQNIVHNSSLQDITLNKQINTQCKFSTTM